MRQLDDFVFTYCVCLFVCFFCIIKEKQRESSLSAIFINLEMNAEAVPRIINHKFIFF